MAIVSKCDLEALKVTISDATIAGTGPNLCGCDPVAIMYNFEV